MVLKLFNKDRGKAADPASGPLHVSEVISPTDTMSENNAPLDRYMSVGRSAMGAIHDAVGDMEPARILDFACGHGRVARHLRAHFPSAEVHVTDLDKVGEDFCVEELGCHRLPGALQFDDIQFEQEFDLIWSGSLLTHLNEEDSLAFFRLAARGLSENGLACLTTHGTYVAGRFFQARSTASPIYGLKPEQNHPMLHGYLEKGFAFEPYPHDEAYGITLMRDDWLIENARECGLEVVTIMPHRWDDHQDVPVFRRLRG